MFLKLPARFPPTYRWENKWIRDSLVRERIEFFINIESGNIAIVDVPSPPTIV